MSGTRTDFLSKDYLEIAFLSISWAEFMHRRHSDASICPDHFGLAKDIFRFLNCFLLEKCGKLVSSGIEPKEICRN